MNNDTGNYAQHARFWDWSGHDSTKEDEYWLQYAAKYGRNVLIPMCAWGKTGAYMVRRGFQVTAFDITPEMIAEGKKRYGDVPGLQLLEGDVTDFRFDIPPVDFCFSMDFEALHSMEEVKKALRCIHAHMREGGCLVIHAGAPPKKTRDFPLETYLPLKQVYPHLKVWKTGSGRDDAKTGRHYISQTFYAEHEDGHVESFAHAFYLQLYSRKEWLSALKACGFKATGGHGGKLETWYSSDDMIEVVRI